MTHTTKDYYPGKAYTAPMRLSCGCHEIGGQMFKLCPLHEAAPKMLEALRAVVALGDNQGRLNLPMVAADARAAIAKAEGRDT